MMVRVGNVHARQRSRKHWTSVQGLCTILSAGWVACTREFDSAWDGRLRLVRYSRQGATVGKTGARSGGMTTPEVPGCVKKTSGSGNEAQVSGNDVGVFAFVLDKGAKRFLNGMHEPKHGYAVRSMIIP